ncbi:unnamed protein product [Allacma fusca]|uniref:Serpin domain-containing protein n=1 Tax=Allacma fusca TaxID=39272 RepID=A0A8J2L2F8_9HEXA|nr:unnamed protein product [Allacma fusca]
MLIRLVLGISTFAVLASAQLPGQYLRRNDQFAEESFFSVRNSKLRRQDNAPGLRPRTPTNSFSGNEDLNSVSSSTVQNIVTANNEFTQKYYQVVSRQSQPNFVFSPFSIVTLLGMLRAGANGKTLKELGTTMNVKSAAAGQLYNGFSELFSNLKTSSKKTNTTFTSSNRLFIQDGFDILTDFQSTLKEKFKAPAQRMDFAQPNVAALINKVVSEDTNGNINDLISPGILNNMTRLVALNVLYFKGVWENTFHGIATKNRDFYTHKGDKIQVETMSTEDYFKIADIGNLKAKAIALPYVGKQMEMVILLPNERDGLQEVEQKFFSDPSVSFDNIVESLNQPPKNVFLYLPKFSLETEQDLQEPLKTLGIQQAFAQFQADFSRISDTERELYLSKILQKAFLNVNEVGSEAGAASYGAVFTPLSIGPPVEETIRVDHPFLGFIRHVDTNLILFAFRKME